MPSFSHPGLLPTWICFKGAVIPWLTFSPPLGEKIKPSSAVSLPTAEAWELPESFCKSFFG